jgi:hypothetical protein
MRLSDFDDFPFHQVPTPFNIVGTSDVHFNDGYWFATFAEGWYLAAGLRLHPNTNVMDGFVGLARDGEQHVVRTSRVLRPDHTVLAVGPLQVEIVRPMELARVTLGGSPVGLAFTLEFEARDRPLLEAPYQHRKYGHLIHDMVRYTQVCRTSGEVTWRGATVAADGWDAIRDHSWGVRSMMGPRTPHGGLERDADEVDHRRFRVWVPFGTDRAAGFFHTHEDEQGETLDFEGHLTFPGGERVRLVAVRHALEYHPGTRYVTGGSFGLLDEQGSWRDYRLEPAGTPADVQGFGYYGGWHDGGSPGVWRGVGPVVEHDSYPVGPEHGRSGPPHLPPDRRLGPTEFPCVVTGPDGERGMAHFEHHILGPYRPYGFN